MFTRSPREKTGLEETIEDCIRELRGYDVTDDKYKTATARLTELYQLREIDRKISEHQKVSSDTKAIVAANLIGIIMIVGHERAHLVGSKALSFILKLR